MAHDNHELLSDLMNLSGSAYKLARVIVRELEAQEKPEVQLTIPKLARAAQLSENTVRSKIKELKFKTIRQREERGKFYFSLQDHFHAKLSWVQKLNPANIAGVQKLNPAKVEPLKNKKSRPRKIPDRLFWKFRQFQPGSDEKLTRTTAALVCQYFAERGANRAAYRALLQSLRGYAVEKKKMTFAQMFKSRRQIEIGVIKYYARLTGGK